MLFSTPMVKAILEGRKTRTRRVIKPQYTDWQGHHWYGKPSAFHLQFNDFTLEDIKAHCPYGQVGDRLWVRETHFIGGIKPNEWAWYRSGFDGDEEGVVWRPSIFMPRWASRLTLEITEVRVERVQEITNDEVLLEGADTKDGLFFVEPDRIMMFHKLWDSINAKRGYSWEVNPWVWVISFRRLI